MTAPASVILFVTLCGLASATRFHKLPKAAGQTSEAECVDNTLYEMFICRNKSDGTQFLVPGSCSQYYKCANGQTSKLSCPNFYDSKTDQCVTQSDCIEVDNTDCVVPTPPPCSSTGNPCPTPSPGPCGNWFDPNDLYGSFVCRDKADGTMLIVRDSCTDYYFCIEGHAYRKSCGSTRYYNPNAQACDEPGNVNCPTG